MAIFFNFSPTSNHLHPLQVENCDSNLRLVVDEDNYGKFRLERVKIITCVLKMVFFFCKQNVKLISLASIVELRASVKNEANCFQFLSITMVHIKIATVINTERQIKCHGIMA